MDKSTIVRTIVLIVAIINSGLVFFGKDTLDISEDTIYQLVSYVFLIGSAARSWWKNNDITQEAKEGTKYMQWLKKEAKNILDEDEQASADPESEVE